MNHREARSAARHAGLRFRDVLSMAQEIATAENEGIEPERELRRMAWERFVGPTRWTWWRCGWHEVCAYAFSAGDRTAIPGFDEIADGIAREYPALLGHDDPSAELFEILKRPCPKLRYRPDCYEKAIRRLIALRAWNDEHEANHAAMFAAAF
ncbi:MAG TPA: hypothetical protein VGX76_12375 [Pirellulales bacterium]|jgi:hypothetical protein|nr:hypothetical protein [Pirellulales bacterium]